MAWSVFHRNALAIFFTSTLSLHLWATSAHADQTTCLPADSILLSEISCPPGRTDAIAAPNLLTEAARRAGPPRPRPLVPLYVSLASLQLLDVQTTARALKNGARESNPLLAGFASNAPAVLALKVGTTAGTIYLTERLWKKNRAAALVMMVGLNSAYAVIVTHNYRTGAPGRARE